MSRDDIPDENTNSIDEIEDLAAILGRDNLQEETSNELSIDAGDADNEIDSLLNNYGIAEENSSKNGQINERLVAMHERVTEDLTVPDEESTNSPVKVVLWLLACVLLIVCLFVQYTVFNINDLVKNESRRATLVSVCKILSCSLPSADIKNLHIVEANHGPSATGKGSDIISQIIKNDGPTQLYPNLKVVMFDQSGGVLGDFIAQPKDYLISDKQKEMAVTQTFFMFTVPIAPEQIYNIEITPFY